MRTAHLYRIPQNGRIALRFRRSEGVFALRPLNKFYNEKKDAVFGEAQHVPLEIVGRRRAASSHRECDFMSVCRGNDFSLPFFFSFFSTGLTTLSLLVSLSHVQLPKKKNLKKRQLGLRKSNLFPSRTTITVIKPKMSLIYSPEKLLNRPRHRRGLLLFLLHTLAREQVRLEPARQLRAS